nr:MAG TPA: hypothetical protein [Caudoviricetes sp.]
MCKCSQNALFCMFTYLPCHYPIFYLKCNTS